MATRFDTPDLEPRPDRDEDDAPFADVVALALAEIQDATDRLATGAISVAEWDDTMRDILATYHLAAFMVGKEDGVLDDDDITAMAEATAEQLDYLDGFLEALEGEPDGSALADKYRRRAEMYGDAIGASYWRGHSRKYGISLPFWPRDGKTVCLNACACQWSIKEVDAEAGDYDATWRLGATDHCDTCKERAKLKPLRIRGGKYDRSQITAGMYA